MKINLILAVLSSSLVTLESCMVLSTTMPTSPSTVPEYSAYTNYAWDSWSSNTWEYVYDGCWVYAIPYGGNPKDFYFRFCICDLGLRELNSKEWKAIKSKSGCLENLGCAFEYYVTDKYPTLKDALAAHSWPCAKYYHPTSSEMPIVLKTTWAKVNAFYTDDDEVRTLNFWLDGCGFALSVAWDFSGKRMTYYF